MGWVGTAFLMIKTQIGIGVLSIPAAFNTLGFVPGIVTLIAVAVITTWVCAGVIRANAFKATLLIRPFIFASPTMSSVASNCATWRCTVSTMLATSCSAVLDERSSRWHFYCVCNTSSSIQSKTMCSRIDYSIHRLGIRIWIGHPEHFHRAQRRL